MYYQMKALTEACLKQLETFRPDRSKRIREAIGEHYNEFRILEAFRKERSRIVLMLFASKQELEKNNNFNLYCDRFVQLASEILKQEPLPLALLPKEMLSEIVKFLDGKSQRFLALTSKHFVKFFKDTGGVASASFKVMLEQPFSEVKYIPVCANGEIVLQKEMSIFTVNSINRKYVAQLNFKFDEKPRETFTVITALAVLTDGKTIAVGNSSGFITVVKDIKTANIAYSFKAHKNKIEQIISISSQHFATRSRLGKRICIWNMATGEKLKELQAPEVIYNMIVSSEEIYCVSYSEIYLLDVKKEIFEKIDQQKYLITINFYGEKVNIEKSQYPMSNNFAGIMSQIKLNDKLVACGYKNGVIHLFDIEKKELVRELEGHKTAIYSMLYLGYGLIASCANKDKFIHIVNLDTGKCIKVLQGHTRAVKILTLLPNEQFASSDSKWTRIWDIQQLKVQNVQDLELETTKDSEVDTTSPSCRF